MNMNLLYYQVTDIAVYLVIHTVSSQVSWTNETFTKNENEPTLLDSPLILRWRAVSGDTLLPISYIPKTQKALGNPRQESWRTPDTVDISSFFLFGAF